MQEIIEKVTDEALTLFLPEEYGFEGFLACPEIKIGLVHYDWKLHLMSDVPRSFANGRYHPCWDCGELAVWVCARLEQKGVQTGVLAIKHETPDFEAMAHHFHWVPAWQSGGGIEAFDITPGSDIDFCKENELISDFEFVEWREFLATRKYINFVASETMLLINWQPFPAEEKKQGFLNYFGIFQQDDTFIFEFETIFVHRGIIVDKKVTKFRFIQKNLWKQQKKFHNNPVRAYIELEPYPGAFAHKIFKQLVAEEVYKDSLQQVHDDFKRNLLPKIFCIFDQKLLQRWAKKSRSSWFDRIFR